MILTDLSHKRISRVVHIGRPSIWAGLEQTFGLIEALSKEKDAAGVRYTREGNRLYVESLGQIVIRLMSCCCQKEFWAR